jgi:hypothetical protein
LFFGFLVCVCVAVVPCEPHTSAVGTRKTAFFAAEGRRNVTTTIHHIRVREFFSTHVCLFVSSLVKSSILCAGYSMSSVNHQSTYRTRLSVVSHSSLCVHLAYSNNIAESLASSKHLSVPPRTPHIRHKCEGRRESPSFVFAFWKSYPPATSLHYHRISNKTIEVGIQVVPYYCRLLLQCYINFLNQPP